MKTIAILVCIPLTVLLTGCQKGPQPIDFGNQLCDHCRMTISDPKFGAQWVTPTGKIFNYDAVECMVWHLEEEPKEGEAFVIAYDQPTQLIPAAQATFLMATGQPSPMGAYLSAYQNEDLAVQMADELDGSCHTWTSIQSGVPNPQ